MPGNIKYSIGAIMCYILPVYLIIFGSALNFLKNGLECLKSGSNFQSPVCEWCAQAKWIFENLNKFTVVSSPDKVVPQSDAVPYS